VRGRVIPAGSGFEYSATWRIPRERNGASGAARELGGVQGPRHSSKDEPPPPPPPTPEELELEGEMEYLVEPEEAFTRDEIE
jgi:hypothetical protein